MADATFDDGGMQYYQQLGQQEQQQQEGSMNVYQAICAITEELSKVGISKDRRNQQQGYQFRGIDDVYAALSPLLAKHKLCILPRVVDREVVERQTAKGGVLFYTTVRMEFDFVSAVDGSKHTVAMIGEAMDSGDKSSNKAQSAAYKYAAFQTFCIPTEGDNDADATTHEVAPRRRAAPFDSNETFSLIANAGSVKALTNLYHQAQDQGASPEQMAKVADACAARKAILQREAQ